MNRLHALAIVLAPCCVFAQTSYLKPPAEIQKVLESPRRPDFSLSPSGDRALLLYRSRYLSIADLAQPMLALGGIRINPANNAPARVSKFVSVTIKEIQSGRETPLELPQNGTVWTATWSPDGRKIAFPVAMADHTELWVADASTGRGHSVENLNATLSGSYRWMPDSKHLVVRSVPGNRGAAPSRSGVPMGPEVQESLGSKRPARTYPDMLKDAADDEAFTYYMGSQLELVDCESMEKKSIGEPGVMQAQPSPNGKYLLVEVTHAPYSHRIGAGGFPHRTEVWPIDGGKPVVIYDAPSEEGLPLDGVPTGPRSIEWRADAPDTLMWEEALDEGNPEKKVDFRDRIMTRPMSSELPRELAKVKERCEGIFYSPNGMAIVQEYVRDTEHDRRYVLNLNESSPKLVPLSDISSMEQYANPGDPIQQVMPNGQVAMVQSGNSVLFTGVGSSPDGDRPFLDKVDLSTLKTERLWRCDNDGYEAVAAVIKPDGSEFVTLRESSVDFPNYMVRHGSATKPLTEIQNPYPQLTSIQKQLVKYKRSDGVECSFTVYLPPGYKKGDRLPAIIVAYPLEYTSADVAGQVTGSTKRFPIFSGALVFVLAGYAVMNATMPIVGDPKTVNDTFISQLVDDAKAAVVKGDQMGIIDPKRVGVMGHSYGAFMTANLLAHSDVIAAGAAESGAYNRSLTPFGFQSERRTFWQAQKMYLDVSPFAFADKIKRPLLLIHGMQDDNPGTYTIQSERMFQALSGNGGTTRLVLLPYEAHGYSALESIEHVIAEELNWFNKYVKGKS